MSFLLTYPYESHPSTHDFLSPGEEENLRMAVFWNDADLSVKIKNGPV